MRKLNFLLNYAYLLLAFKLLPEFIGQAEASSAMKRLYEDLFSDYNRLILPVARNKTKVRVSVGLKLGQILDLNLKQQILSTNVWVEQNWHDYKLEWNPDLYDGIDMIHVPAENIWIPDIVLFNNADGNYELTLVAKARVYFNGTVIWRPPTMFRSTCEIDVEFFPFDIQTCYLRFGSWTYAGDEVELSLSGGNKTKILNGIDLSQFYKNVEWDIIDVPAYYNENQYDCCPEPYPDITFKIVIRRKILFYLVNLILPVALMTFLTVSVFYLPSDSNEKVTMSISILTSLIVFFLLMLEIIPASSLAVPLFGKYLLFTLVLVSLSACVSVYVLNMHHRSPTIHQMSPKMRQLFLKTLPRLLLLNQPDPRERSSLNRFRQKKIAQQLLKQAASPSNHMYDLAQPMAASLNLIETLHKSYRIDSKSDDPKANKSSSQNGTNEISNDDEGRYFRRYVDEYICQLKKRQQQQQQQANLSSSQQHQIRLPPNQIVNNNNNNNSNNNRCSTTFVNGQQLRNNSSAMGNQCYSAMDSYTSAYVNERSTDPLLCPPKATLQKLPNNNANFGTNPNWPPISTNCRNQQAPTTTISSISIHLNNNNNNNMKGSTKNQHLGLLNDDTLDMTFDCDDQQPIDECSESDLINNMMSSTNIHQRHTNNNSNKHQHQRKSPCSGLIYNHNNINNDNAMNIGNKLDDLPSPPPPPRELSQLTSRSGRNSSCGHQAQSHMMNASANLNHEIGNLQQRGDNINNNINSNNTNNTRVDHYLVDKLINNIQLINEIEVDTTNTPTTTATTTSVNEPNIDIDDDDEDIDSPMNRTQASLRLIKMSNKDQALISSANPLRAQARSQNSTSHNNQYYINNNDNDNNNNNDHNVTADQFDRLDPTLMPGFLNRDFLPGPNSRPSELLLSLRLPYDKMPAHVRAAIRSVLFIADTIKNEDDENSAIEDWQAMSMVVDRLFFCLFFLLCSIGSIIILGSAPALYDYRVPIDDQLRINLPAVAKCSASHDN